MEKLRSAAKIADRILGILTGIFAAVLLIYSAYVLYDNFRIGENAFSSWDMQQYKPTAVKEDGTLDFSELKKINPDTIGWVTIFDTNIDYPIMQGKNDLEYINKDIYGNSSLTGSIYLSSENDGEFLNNYNIIYGHHMDNGAMFGDVNKYSDESYFMSHRKGELITPKGLYDLTVFACLRTNAYSSEVYALSDLKNKRVQEIISYLRENAEKCIKTDYSPVKKVVALSTCAGESTNGRIVIFCDASPKKAVMKGNQSVTPVSGDRIVRGHHTGENVWALLNLICVLITLFTLIPLFSIRKKYRQLPYTRNKYKEYDEQIKQNSQQRTVDDDKIKEIKVFSDDLKHFFKKMVIGIAAEAIILIAGVIAFLLTEDMSTPMVISDQWTGLMVGISIIGLIADFIFFRYRGKRLPQEQFE